MHRKFNSNVEVFNKGSLFSVWNPIVSGITENGARQYNIADADAVVVAHCHEISLLARTCSPAASRLHGNDEAP